MIEAKELRIGNMVSFRQGKGAEPSLHTILAIETGAVKLSKSYTMDYWSTQEESDIDPVELTPKWLERCGFQWDENRYDGETKIVRKGCLELHHDEDQPLTGYSIALFDDGNISFAVYDIRYLHQLQNLYFALTGDELIINIGV